MREARTRQHQARGWCPSRLKIGLLTLCTALGLGLAPSLRAATTQDLPDTDIADAVEHELLMDSTVPFHTTDVKVTEGIVTLSGTVDTMLARRRAVELAQAIKGVRSVVNEIDVRTIARSDDELRLDVERALMSDPAADSYEVTATVKDGVVTMVGTVDSWQEKQLVRRVVEGVRGVRGIDSRVTFDVPTARPDQEVAAEIRKRLHWDARVDDGLITAKVEDGKATLSGTVGSALERAYAIGDAWVPGVDEVDATGLEVEWWARDEMRREKYAIKTDSQIRDAVQDAMLYDPRVLSFNPEVRVQNGVVTLSGTVDNLEARRAAQMDARNTVGVVSVRNHLRVRPTTALSDSEITDKVEQALRRDPVVDRLGIAVTTYLGEVTLLGDVGSWLERSRAETIASRIPGVVDVNNRLDVTTAVTLLNDMEIEEEIEDELFWSPFVDSDDVHVTVADGVATLTGTVDTWAELGYAAENAREGGALSVRNKLQVRNGEGAFWMPF